MASFAEPEPTTEPRAELPKPRPEPEGEPLPEWHLAKQTWGAAWGMHWIGMAVFFAIASIIAIFFLRRIYKRKRKQQTMAKFALTVTFLIALFTTSRFLYLIINPYESSDCLFGERKCPLFVSRFLFSIGMPSLSSAYFLLHLALLDVVKMRKLNNFTKLQNWWFLAGLVCFNHILSCTADLVVAYVTSARLFLAICQGYFIAFSGCLVAAFVYSGVKIYRTNRDTKSQVYKMSVRHPGDTTTQKLTSGGSNVKKVLRLTIATAVLGAVFLVLQIYALAVVYMVADGKYPKPWPWLIYQYVYRFVELSLASCVLYNISYMPRKGRTVNRQSTYRQGTVSSTQKNSTQ